MSNLKHLGGGRFDVYQPQPDNSGWTWIIVIGVILLLLARCH